MLSQPQKRQVVAFRCAAGKNHFFPLAFHDFCHLIARPLHCLLRARPKFMGPTSGISKLLPDKMQKHPLHFGINRRTCALQIMAYHEGDARYAYAEQPCQIVFPEKNTNGRPQKINFPRIPDQPRSAQSVELHATADSGLPVEYFVRQGPAELEGTRLKFTPIPPRAKFPIKVTVTAYQWGRPLEPLVQSAQPVEQTFLLPP